MSKRVVLDNISLEMKKANIREYIAVYESKISNISNICESIKELNYKGGYVDEFQSLAVSALEYHNLCISYYEMHIEMISNIATELYETDATLAKEGDYYVL